MASFDLCSTGQYMSLIQHLVQMGAMPIFVALFYFTCQYLFFAQIWHNTVMDCHDAIIFIYISCSVIGDTT